MNRRAAALTGVVIGLGILFYLEDLRPTYTDHAITLGPLEIPGRAAGNIVPLLNTSTSTPALGDYDSLDRPRGTDYVVPTGRRLRLTQFVTSATSTPLTVTLGYATVHVSATSTAPAGAVTLFSLTAPAGAGVLEVSLGATVPAGGYPWAFLDADVAGDWPSTVNVAAVLETP